MHPRIADTLARKPFCTLITRDTHHVARRLSDIDKGYFVLFNHKRNRYEVHNTRNLGDTYCFVAPYNELDGRTVEYAIETSSSNIIATIKSENEKLERLQKQRHVNERKDMAADMADRLSFAVDEDDLHEGYSNIHYVRKGV